jgi:Tol biopolymer transport system component
MTGDTMNIELDWQIVDDDTEQPEQIVPSTKPGPRLWHRWLLAFALFAVTSIVSVAGYVAWTYHVNLTRAVEQVRPVAALEAQAVATNDRDLFLALQDPEDSAWRSMQAQRFARLERVGVPELGWQATDTCPTSGGITLEPGGARLDVTYHFSIAQPMPDGPTSVTLRVPQFYKFTPAGWVRAMPGADFWGPPRAYNGKRVTAIYFQRDADLLEPMIQRMDKMLEQFCDALACPSQPAHIVFENTADALARLSDCPYGFEEAFTLRFPSPYLLGLPTDRHSCDELYRAISTRMVLALVYEASGRQLDMSHLAARAIMQCELARAGLARSPLDDETRRAVSAALWMGWSPLSVIPLQSPSPGKDTRPAQSLLPFALAFVEEHFGPGSVARLIPAMTSATLGQAIREGMGVDPATLESAWLMYTLQQTDWRVDRVPHPVPVGELALLCEPERIQSGLWRAHINETAAPQAHLVDASGFDFAWSPDGDKLAYAFVQDLSQPIVQVEVIDAASGQIEATLDRLTSASLDWRSDGSLCVHESDKIHLLNGATNTTLEIAGTDHTWSPDGTHLAYVATGADQISTIWIADALGRHAQPIAQGQGPVWSPDGKRVAFWSGACMDSSCHKGQPLQAARLLIFDTSRNAAVTLARSEDLLKSGHNNLDLARRGIVIGDIAWSPDGTILAVTIAQEASSPVLLVLGADDGTIRARVTADAEASQAGWDRLGLSLHQAWSSDSRYVSFGAWSSSTWYGDSGVMGILDMQTSQSISLPCAGEWDWLADGQWLAVPQRPSGVLLVTPDLSEMQWLNTPASFSVAWRPGSCVHSQVFGQDHQRTKN